MRATTTFQTIPKKLPVVKLLTSKQVRKALRKVGINFINITVLDFYAINFNLFVCFNYNFVKLNKWKFLFSLHVLKRRLVNKVKV